MKLFLIMLFSFFMIFCWPNTKKSSVEPIIFNDSNYEAKIESSTYFYITSFSNDYIVGSRELDYKSKFNFVVCAINDSIIFEITSHGDIYFENNYIGKLSCIGDSLIIIQNDSLSGDVPMIKEEVTE